MVGTQSATQNLSDLADHLIATTNLQGVGQSHGGMTSQMVANVVGFGRSIHPGPSMPIARQIASVALIMFLAGCGSSTSPVQARPQEPPPAATEQPQPENTEQAKPTMVTQENLGKQITVEGIAADAKLGALLQMGQGGDLWIADLQSWPDGYWSMPDGGKKVRVTGILGEDHSLPVFEADMAVVLERGDPIPQGIIIPPQIQPTDGLVTNADEEVAIKPASDSARHRYILKEAKWEVIED